VRLWNCANSRTLFPIMERFSFVSTLLGDWRLGKDTFCRSPMVSIFLAENAAGIVGARRAHPSVSLSMPFVVTRAVECDKNRCIEINVSRFHWFDKRESDRGECASKEEFVSLFEAERMALYRLALLLTANSEAAECCLVLAFRECIANSSVSKEWAFVWARRAVIRNAINVVVQWGEQPFAGMNGSAEGGSIEFSEDGPLGQIANSQPVLALPDLDRLVFVICILERHSIHDCALLLGKPLRDINVARQRAIDQIKQIDESPDSSVDIGDSGAVRPVART
jgi:DNA-directed RNA polymerase specialized sigma24 family protein